MPIDLAATTPPAPPRSPPRPSETNDSPSVGEVVRLVNQHRVRAGCPPLAWNPRLANVAEAHSRDMARRGFFSHENPDGLDPFERMRAAGLSFRAAAENIAAGQRTGGEVFESWRRSAGHRANIERCLYVEHGIGRYENHWTHVFMTPRTTSTRRTR